MMEKNTSLLLMANDSTEEFPYWQPTAAIDLSAYLFVTLIAIFVLNLPLLVAFFKMKKKKYLTAINILHISLLIASIVEDILRASARCWYLPNVYRYCFCAEGGYIMTVVVLLYFIFFRCSMFASLSVIQFLLVFGKKKWATLKVSFGLILLCIGIGFLAIAASIRGIIGSRERVSCFNAHCPGHRPESGISNLIVVVFGFTLGAYLPSTAVVIIVSTWSCAIFKKYYIGGDDDLNRRMLALPFIMPLANLTSTVLDVLSMEIISAIMLNLPLGVYFTRWILFTQSVALILLRFINRLTYPLVLLYTHVELRRSVSALLKQLFKPGGNNSVAPS
jgi:hypothetical protein